MMNWSTLSDIVTSISEIAGVASMAFGGLFYVTNSLYAKKKELNEFKETLEADMSKLDVRLTTMEETLKHQPTSKDLQSVSDRIGLIAIEVGKIGATCSAQSDLLRSIDQRLTALNK